MNLKRFGRKRSWRNLKVLSRHLSGWTEENNENPQSRIAGRRDRDLNSGPPECETSVLTTRLLRSVSSVLRKDENTVIGWQVASTLRYVFNFVVNVQHIMAVHYRNVNIILA
jgi:hypothetical protein